MIHIKCSNDKKFIEKFDTKDCFKYQDSSVAAIY